MTKSTSHIAKASPENMTTNTTPKTVMGSGIAPPRLSNDARPSFRQESLVLNIDPTVLLGAARFRRG